MSTNYFDRINGTNLSTTGTGLDQLVDTMSSDLGLMGRVSDQDLIGGNQAANAMNQIIVDAVTATGIAPDGVFSESDVRTLNAYIRSNYLEEWTQLHGDDERGEETGFHLIQNDGASERYRGDNLTNTVADGIYHLGFEIQGDNILNEDGNANATIQQLSEWLTQFWTDHSTTQTGLDRMTDMVMADKGLDRKISDEDIAEGADAANGMNAIIHEAIAATNATEGGAITVDDVRAINAYIRAYHQDEWVALHGDDEGNGEETGYHLVQNDGAKTRMFGENFVNTVADGVYHLGFEIQGDRILNEDGNANATLTDLADWLNFFYTDQGTTDTGLDALVDVVKSDRGLSKNTDAGDINAGAAAANEMNHILVEAIEQTGIAADNVISVEDVRAINTYIRANYLDEWTELHGDDERGEETGYHLVQNDGAKERYRGDNFVNTVIDGIYHLGFAIKGDNILNEDGNRNANLGDLATWLNNFYLGEENTFGSAGNDNISTLNVDDKIWAREGNDQVRSGDGDDQVWGGEGKDYLDGGAGDDKLYGEAGNDNLQGRDGDDELDAGEGNNRLWGHDGDDTMSAGAGKDYMDGGSGNDTLSSGGGDDNLQGRDGNDSMDAGEGNNRLWGHDGNDTMSAGAGKDYMDGGSGNDTLSSGGGDDNLQGRDGDDKLDAGEGNNRLWGHDGNDTMSAGAGKDYMDGGAGNDTLSSGGGDDNLQGRDGDDKLDAGEGNNRLWGHDGNDTMSAGAGKDYMDGGSGDDALSSGAGDDNLQGRDGNDTLDGGAGNDGMFGHNDDDVMHGGAGNDYMDGGAGDDILIDGAGSDTVIARNGDDKLYGVSDGNNDVFWGHGGADSFHFLAEGSGIGSDTIGDFSAANGDQLVIGGPDVEYEISQLSGNRSQVSLSNGQGEDLGNITVYGNLDAENVTLDNDAFVGISQNSLADIA
ncbi:MAG: calcium-binding protein [Candidatus Sedimenticola sp. (ex Thyasira tokunagai)]